MWNHLIKKKFPRGRVNDIIIFVLFNQISSLINIMLELHFSKLAIGFLESVISVCKIIGGFPEELPLTFNGQLLPPLQLCLLPLLHAFYCNFSPHTTWTPSYWSNFSTWFLQFLLQPLIPGFGRLLFPENLHLIFTSLILHHVVDHLRKLLLKPLLFLCFYLEKQVVEKIDAIQPVTKNENILT